MTEEEFELWFSKWFAFAILLVTGTTFIYLEPKLIGGGMLVAAGYVMCHNLHRVAK